MPRLISLLHGHICKKPFRCQWRNLCYVSVTHPLPFDLDPPHELDQTMATLYNIYTNPVLNLLHLCRSTRSLKKVHGLFIVHGLSGDLFCSTKLVSSYGLFGHVGLARSVFDRIPDPDFYLWKVMMRWYFLNDLHEDVIGLYARMRMFTNEADNVVFSVVLKAASEGRDLDVGRKVHCEIVKAGNPDSFVLTGLVDMYAKCGMIECSRCVFEENDDRNVVSWTSMIVGYVQNDCPHEGLVLFNRMREGLVGGNHFTLVSLVSACTKLGALHQGKWIHGCLIKTGIKLNSHLITALLDMYAKCGVVKDARFLFDEMLCVDPVSWTTMIAGYAQNGCPEEALNLFTDQKWIRMWSNNVTLLSVLSVCAQLGNLSLGMSVHGLGIKLGLEEPAIINALVDMYSKCNRNESARYLFETVLDKDVVAWNSIISGYSNNGSAYEALELFHQMRMESVLPDEVTLVSILLACASLAAFYAGSSVHAYSVKRGKLSCNVKVGTALLTFYSKCGDVRSARLVFDGMEEKSIVTWSAMIGGYGVQGDVNESLALLDDMIKEKLEPNEVIFTNILSACSHAGMVEEGWKHFVLMCKDYNFVPSMKHCACMVDLLARSGRLDEALTFIENMPVQPDIHVFGAFLHGCELHSRFDYGEVAIRKMLELHPDKASYYVLICNLYAKDGRWSQVGQVREMMKQRGLVKSSGYSLTETDICYKLQPSRLAAVA
ncbi:hypothetical protein K2173_021947 [Erythroxylum novogranatense]|uniref:Pentatricopeptide repeat-containing protein n=1 Tax=Erythroxylum novogranatense TaxID=1862640 RepID=A0AAV8T3G3_9ROSI|nr:hypothetical protein K2173_021947 [Erythroxylum novogranatense]